MVSLSEERHQQSFSADSVHSFLDHPAGSKFLFLSKKPKYKNIKYKNKNHK
jgi:hypothetical protein